MQYHTIMSNKLVIAAAGSGKTNFLISEAIKKKNSKILITTYTIANSKEIQKKFIKKIGHVPCNVTIQTWFSFLIQHGVKPFQGHFDEKLFSYNVKGLLLTNEQSAVKYKNSNGINICFKEEEILKHFFSSDGKIYSDKLSKFIVGGGDKFRKKKERKKFVELVFNRLSKLYTDIFIDEVQDLAGYDLEFLKLIFQSEINSILVCDSRQVTYLTHHEKKYNKYKYGKIKEFVLNECKKCFNKKNIDEKTFNASHRNNTDICTFSSKLYSEYNPTKSCSCIECNKKQKNCLEGIFLVKNKDIDNYLFENKFITQLRNKRNVCVNKKYPCMNFGESKGLTFNGVLIYPTDPFMDWLKNNNYNLAPTSRSKFYVAITRASYNVGIVCDENIKIDGIKRYKP